ncbi:MAG: hypothetical protein PHV34_24850 [Verrucomicrobiae bacterium]|nr:hypothetical protein [Verrucomicrobiae bacterium]
MNLSKTSLTSILTSSPAHPFIVFFLCAIFCDLNAQENSPPASIDKSGASPKIIRISPASTNDWGAGASCHTQWYFPGGSGRSGLFAGQINTIRRNERSLIRFDLSSLATRGGGTNWLASATLAFVPRWFCGPQDSRQIECSHLKYEPQILCGNDLANDEAEIAGVITVLKPAKKADPLKFDVTRWVQSDVWNGFAFSAFRFRDVHAEEGYGQPAGLSLGHPGESLPFLEIIEK